MRVLALLAVFGCAMVGLVQAETRDFRPYLANPNARCGNLAFLDFGEATDGPSYYVNATTGALVSNCGGCFMVQNRKEGDCGPCPPKEWTCEDPIIDPSKTQKWPQS